MALSTPTMGPALETRVLGIPFRIELPFILVLGELGYVGGRSAVAAAEWIVLGGLSIAVHELGHAFPFRAFGVAPRIRLHGWGGETHGATLTPARDVVVSAAGPLTGLAIDGVVWLAATLGSIPEGERTGSMGRRARLDQRGLERLQPAAHPAARRQRDRPDGARGSHANAFGRPLPAPRVT
jgi:hypothetical protein